MGVVAPAMVCLCLVEVPQGCVIRPQPVVASYTPYTRGGAATRRQDNCRCEPPVRLFSSFATLLRSFSIHSRFSTPNVFLK